MPVASSTLRLQSSQRLRTRLAPIDGLGPVEGYHRLALVVHGNTAAPEGEDAVVARTPLEPLGAPLVELFETPSVPHRGCEAGIEFAEDNVVLFGNVLIEDRPLEAATQDAFRRILELTRDRGYLHPLRLWVSLPNINCQEEGLERYRTFCRGRSLAFEAAHGANFTRRLCASSAVGSAAGPLAIYCLASRNPGTHWENPRQVAAYEYPSTYGPRSPSFARATIAPSNLDEATFIAGTASIVGHENQHPDCVLGQLDETLANLSALLESLPGERSINDLGFLKVYLRDPAHQAVVRDALDETPWGVLPALYLRADICRRELLVEIEAVG
ncbi:MAG: hypothetical protein K8J08_17585 [Thermoanaerobaculia bacterium]|nr:hypothetical protein [Thermoanaerobaculia bacterium]